MLWLKWLKIYEWNSCKDEIGVVFSLKSGLFASRGIKRHTQHVAKVLFFVTRWCVKQKWTWWVKMYFPTNFRKFVVFLEIRRIFYCRGIFRRIFGNSSYFLQLTHCWQFIRFWVKSWHFLYFFDLRTLCHFVAKNPRRKLTT